MIVYRSDKMPDKHNMVWTDRFSEERHLSFTRCTISFSIITLHTRCNEIFP